MTGESLAVPVLLGLLEASALGIAVYLFANSFTRPLGISFDVTFPTMSKSLISVNLAAANVRVPDRSRAEP
jgi:hypothetical protein